jgi:hypothetical protein
MRLPTASVLLRVVAYLERRFPATASPGAQQPDGKEVALRVRLADAGVQDLPVRATVPIPERQCVVHHDDGSHQNVGRAHRASQTPYRKGGIDNPSSGADDDSGDTTAQFRSTDPVVR